MEYLDKIIPYHEKRISDYDKLYYNMEKKNMYFIPEDYIYFLKYDINCIKYIDLSNNKLFDLLNKYKKEENTYEIKQIKTALIVKNIRLINWTIRHFFDDLNVDKEDIQECGLEGLLLAINKYSLDKNCLFTKYAVIRIFSVIKTKMKSLIGITYIDYNNRKMLQHYKDEILKLSSNHHQATNIELTDFTDLKLSSINELDDIYEVKEYDDDITQYEDDDINYEIILKLFKERLPIAFIQLTDRQLSAILYEYGFLDDSITRKQIGDLYNVSSETIRTDSIKALKELRKFYNSDEIEYIVNSSYDDKYYQYINELYTKNRDYSLILKTLQNNNIYKNLEQRDFERKIGYFKKLLSYVKSNMTTKQIVCIFYEKCQEVLSFSFVNEMIDIYRIKKELK